MALPRGLELAVDCVAATLPAVIGGDGGISGTPEASAKTTKGDGTPVTVVDVAVQAAIAHRLRAAGDKTPIIGEENARSGWADRPLPWRMQVADLAGRMAGLAGPMPDETLVHCLAAARETHNKGANGNAYWTVDPIDGTKGFVDGGQYAICLARVEDGRPRVGVVACPRLGPPPADPEVRSPGGTLYGAADGRLWTARIDRAGGCGDLVPVLRPPPDEEGPLRVAMSKRSGHTDPGVLGRIEAALGRPVAAVRLDGQGKYGLVAEGRVDVYVRVPRVRRRVETVWDHAPGHAVVAAAGLAVTDVRGRPYDLSRPPTVPDAVGVVVAPPSLHRAVLSAVAPGAAG